MLTRRSTFKTNHMPAFQCPICKLKYKDEKTAKECEAWCGTHDSCNFQIARQAINKDEVAHGRLDDTRFNSKD